MDMDTSAALAAQSSRKEAQTPEDKGKGKGKKRRRLAAEDTDTATTAGTAGAAGDEHGDGDAPVASTSAAVLDTSEQPKKSKKDKKLRKAERQAERNGLAVAKTPAPPAAAPSASFAEVHRPQKPSAKAKAGKGRHYTVSVALPGSILLNAQSPELRTYLAGQIARTCAIFSVDEVVVFHEPNHVSSAALQESNTHHHAQTHTRGKYRQPAGQDEVGTGDENDMDATMARILEYLETPQYLRKALVPMNPVLRLAGLLPPLDMHHHFRRTDADAPYREGVTVERPYSYQPVFGQSTTDGVFVDVGLGEPIFAKTGSQPQVGTGQRVTVRMTDSPYLVAPSLPRTELGFAWGFSVREASSISKVLLDCPYEGGYDLTIGTSERGRDVAQLASDPEGVPEFSHALLVLGGLAGLELTIEADAALGLKAEESDAAFDNWINVCPSQGSRTIRTEEALTIALARLKGVFESRGR